MNSRVPCPCSVSRDRGESVSASYDRGYSSCWCRRGYLILKQCRLDGILYRDPQAFHHIDNLKVSDGYCTIDLKIL